MMVWAGWEAGYGLNPNCQWFRSRFRWRYHKFRRVSTGTNPNLADTDAMEPMMNDPFKWILMMEHKILMQMESQVIDPDYQEEER